MKNVKDNQLKTCIFLTAEEFNEIIRKTLGDDVVVSYALDGLDIYSDERVIQEPEEALQEYFGVKHISSIHIDDCDYTGVWIVYKD